VQLKLLSSGFATFMFALGGYFLLLPLRDEAGVSLGTNQLPRLFLASLLLTFLATPLASAFLLRFSAKERGVQLLLRVSSLSILGEDGGFESCCSRGSCPVNAKHSCIADRCALTLQDFSCCTW
jgi:hypothetical protein